LVESILRPLNPPRDYLDLATTPGDANRLHIAPLSYDVSIRQEGLLVGASGPNSEVWLGDWRRLFPDNTKADTVPSVAPLKTQKQSLTLTTAAS
jgi:hypothetical protein